MENKEVAPFGGARGPLVPIRPVYEHVMELMSLGMTLREIGQRAGVPPQRVHYISKLKMDHLTKPVADRIMAVRWEAKYTETERHPIYPSQRRMGALMRIGWPGTVIAEEAGISQPVQAQIFQGTRRLFVFGHQALGLEVAYEKLHATPGPSDKTRLEARRNNWPPPIAWHEGELDDPEPTVLGRVQARWKKMDKPTPGEQLYDLIEMNDYTLEEVAERLGVGMTGVRRWVSDRASIRGGYAEKLCKMLHVDELPIAVTTGGPRPRPKRA